MSPCFAVAGITGLPVIALILKPHRDKRIAEHTFGDVASCTWDLVTDPILLSCIGIFSIMMMLWYFGPPDLTMGQAFVIVSLLSWLLIILVLRWFHGHMRYVVPDVMMKMNLKGDDGPPGDIGFRGEKGKDGPKGDTGKPGRHGRNGIQGPIGPPGKSGPAGANGVDGQPGRDGISGQPGAVGPSGDHGPPGAAGPSGRIGRDGVPGFPGAVGPAGQPGKRGEDGVEGRTGRDGMPGSFGQPGKNGAKGDTGPEGVPGADGRDGRDGRDGKDGVHGKDGATGLPGKDGNDGKKGGRGLDGRDGTEGRDGRDGQNCIVAPPPPPPPEQKRNRGAGEVFNAPPEILDADVDRDGNAIGTQYDLGRDGAYKGLRVVFLQLHTETSNGVEFNGDLPVQALKSKGFEVSHHKLWNKAPPTPENLDKELKESSQLWLVAGSKNMLTDAHFDVILKHWESGLGLYIFGDNVPFFVDANLLLSKISGSLGLSPPLVLQGNSPAQQMAGKMTDGKKTGFRHHLITTGLAKLYEGHTLSWLSRDTAGKAGLEDILIDHDEKLVVAALPRRGSRGPVVIDGGWTRLFLKWSEGGTDRLVRNCACWLSADTAGCES